MTDRYFAPIATVTAVIAALILHSIVTSRTGTETFQCVSGVCELDSGFRSLLRGMAIVGPGITALGFAWSRWQHQRNTLGPFADRWIPDGEQIFEVLATLAAGLFTYWYIRNGPAVEAVDVGAPNSWARSIRNFNQPEGTPPADLVPTVRSWFLIGAALVTPFAMSFGSMLGREFYGLVRRRSQRREDKARAEAVQTIDLRDHSGRGEALPPSRPALEAGDNGRHGRTRPDDSLDFDF